MTDNVFQNHCTISNDVKNLCRRYILSQQTEKTSFLLKLASSHACDVDTCVQSAKTFIETAVSHSFVFCLMCCVFCVPQQPAGQQLFAYELRDVF